MPPDDQDQEQGEMMDVEGSQSDVQDTDDGGAMVTVEDDQPAVPEGFFDNLVEVIPPEIHDAMVQDLLDKVEFDQKARENRDKQYAEGLKRSGFSDEAPGGATFTGASRVVHPMIGKVAVEFSARLMKEIFPPGGPVKDDVIGEVTGEKVEKARRKTTHLNWQLTKQIREFRPTLEQVTTQVPMGGAQYMKVFYDRQNKRPAVEPVWIDSVLLPYNAASFYTAERRTIVLDLTEFEYKQRVDDELYRDVDLAPSSLEPELTKAAEASSRIEGKTSSGFNEDGIRRLYEIYVSTEFPDEMRPEGYRVAPYVITLDESTRKIATVYRNWDPEIQQVRGIAEELQHLVEFPFIPWRGAYPLGIYHLIGGLSISATGAIRALLDSAHINNMPTVLRLKGMLRGGQNISLAPTQVHELESSVSNDDIRKYAMPLPFNPPSPVLYELLGFLTQQGESVVRTALEDIPEMGSSNAPVGTTLARIEQGLIVFSSIHARMHYAMEQVLQIIHRINRDTLDEEVLDRETGEVLAYASDYEIPSDVALVSDPNIFSEQQRAAQTQIIAQRATGNPLYDQAKVERRILETFKVPNPEELLIAPPEPEPTDPITENVSLTLGRPATAFPNQDHLAHLMTHLSFLSDSNLGMSMLIGPTFIPPMLNHVKEHLVLFYARSVADAVERAAGVPLKQLIDQSSKTQGSLAKAFSSASDYVRTEQKQIFNQVTQAVTQAIQFMQKMQSVMQPQDPTLAAVEVQKQDVQRRAQADQVNAQVKQAELQHKDKVVEMHAQLDAKRLEQEGRAQEQDQANTLQDRAVEAGLERGRQDLERELGQLRERIKVLVNHEDNVTAMKIALMDLAVPNDKAAVSTGHGINP
jgi:hypothetical protein